ALADLITTAPRLSDPDAARLRVSDWLAGVSPANSKPLKALFSERPIIGTLVDSLAESSPYLWDLIVREPDRLLRLLQANPEQHFAALLKDHGRAAALSRDEAEAMRPLRRMKAEASLLIALADIGGVWPVMRAAHALAELADAAVSAATQFLLSEA